MLQICHGTYRRQPEDVWRYAWGPPVPGARDLTLADMLALDTDRPLTNAEHEWASGVRAVTDEVLVQPTPGRRPDARDLVVGMVAPELHAPLMLTVEQVAERAGVSKATIDSYRYRGYLPDPQATVGRTPLWARPVVTRWIELRPGAGWRSDLYGEVDVGRR